MYRIFHYFGGYIIVTVKSVYAERFISHFINKNIPIWNISIRDGDAVVFYIRKCHENMLISKSKEMGAVIDYKICGFPVLWSKYKRRYGLFLGGLLGALIVFFSFRYVWQIDIVGNSEISDEEVLLALGNVGVKEGAKKSDLDIGELQLKFVSRNTKFSFCAINLHGMMAFVEVKERDIVDGEEDKSLPINLVASCDGIITLFKVSNGEIKVKIEEPVAKGELLVSGIMDIGEKGYKIVKASGKVYADTKHYFDFSVPMTEIRKTRTGRSKTVDEISFLGKGINLSLNYGNLYEKYDIIKNNETVSLLGFQLPLRKNIVTAYEYTESEHTLTYVEAVDKAFDMYNKFIESLDEATVTKLEYYIEEKEGVTRLYGTVECNENIAVPKSFEVRG